MLGDITINEVELLNAYEVLAPNGQRELKGYLHYLLYKQYKRDAMAAVFNNKLLHNLFHSLMHIVERDDFDLTQVSRRVQQIKELYYALFEQVHNRYSQHVEELDSSEVVLEFGRTSFSTLERVLMGNNLDLIRYEVVNFYQEFNKLSKKRDARKIIAV